MSDETEAAIRTLREAAPEITDAAVRYIYAGAITEMVIGVLLAVLGALLIRAAIREQKKEYGESGIIAAGWGFGGFAVCIALGCVGEAVPALVSPAGRAIYALVSQ